MKVLVTGGAGFIGSHVVDLLIENNYDVVIVDDLSTGRRENINKGAKFCKLDIRDEKLEEIFKSEKPDSVVHHAAQINVRSSIENPVFDARVNILGSLNLLECCRKHDVRKIVYASSGGAVYGEPEYLPADERHPIKPLCPYGASKYAVEHYLDVYDMNYGINHVSLRYANVYGPRQDPLGEAGVVAIFIGKLLKGETPTINGDGSQTRDFVYAKDVAVSNLMALEKKTREKTFNIGTGMETSVNKIAGELTKILDSKLKPTHGPAIKGEVYRVYLDCKLAEKELSWKPKISLDMGLKETVGWFSKSYLAAL